MQIAAPDEVIVIDNGSDPPLDLPFTIIRNERNVGFSPACNQGLRAASSDIVVFLNNDIIAQGNWLEPIKANIRPGVLVGPVLRSDQHTGIDGYPVPYLDGWCLAGYREEFIALGGWDEEYEEPSYYGDNDLCARAKARGMKLVEAPLPLQHLANATSKTMDFQAVSARNRQRYEKRVKQFRCSGS